MPDARWLDIAASGHHPRLDRARFHQWRCFKKNRIEIKKCDTKDKIGTVANMSGGMPNLKLLAIRSIDEYALTAAADLVQRTHILLFHGSL